MPLMNIDTDMIIPKQFLKTIQRSGLGIHLFDEMRYDSNGEENPEFVLNQLPYRKSSVLIAGENFGCGSSREHAPWALLDFGIRCVIASSFADIFFGNCFKNGILPVILPKDQVETLMEFVKNPENEININLEEQTVSAGNHVFSFDITEHRKDCLINGLDDIGLTLKHQDKIAKYEQDLEQKKPWVL